MRIQIERFYKKCNVGLELSAAFASRKTAWEKCGAHRDVCKDALALILLASLAWLPLTAGAQSSGGVGIGIGPVTSSPAQQNSTVVPLASPPIRVDVKLVTVFVNVADANGSPVGGLIKDNFALAEDGRPQKIAIFDRESAVPLSIVLAIDTSGTVHKDSSIELHAAREFVHALMRPVDQLDLMEFASDVREVVPFTSNLHQIDSGLERLRGGPATALYDTIFLASQSLASRPGRKVLVLITDGDDTVKGVDYPRASSRRYARRCWSTASLMFRSRPTRDATRAANMRSLRSHKRLGASTTTPSRPGWRRLFSRSQRTCGRNICWATILHPIRRRESFGQFQSP